MPPGIATVLSVLRSSALVVDEKDEVVKASAPAYAFGVVSGNQVNVQELADLIRQVRRDGQIRETELVMARGRGIAPQHVTARVAPLSSRLVLALVEDRTRERRVEAIRRDFVANVSHELKTPVGALNLLAEAVQEAADDPEAVSRFAGRMQTESARLNRLVQQIIELSRLQGDDPLEDPQVVDVDEVVTRAIDQSDIDAQSKKHLAWSTTARVLCRSSATATRSRWPSATSWPTPWRTPPAAAPWSSGPGPTSAWST